MVKLPAYLWITLSLILEKIPEANEEQKKKALLKAQQDCISLGLTTVDIAGLNRKDIELINNFYNTGELKIKVYAMLSDNEGELPLLY